jgi:CopG-like RHH_1 or ribbon-helix-helix domain, RHH_5
MPTVKPRIAVTLPHHVGETYKRIADLQGRSVASVAAELLVSVHEPMCRTLAILEAARDAPRAVLDGLREAAEEIERDMADVHAASLGQLDWIVERVRSPSAEPSASPPLVARKPRKKARRPSSA